MATHDDFSLVTGAAIERVTGEIDAFTTAYISGGGTWILATTPLSNDDGNAHDLLAVLPAPIEETRVVPLRITVNPDLVNALRAALDPVQEG